MFVIGHKKYEGKLMDVLGGKEVLRASVERSLEEVMERTSVHESSSSSCLVSVEKMGLVVIWVGMEDIVRGMR